MKTAMTDMLKIRFPIIQGAMAWLADSSLASAVSNAGGLGMIASGNASCDIIRKEIHQTKELTDRPFGVNIMLLSPHAEKIVELVLEEDVRIVTTGAGNPEKYMRRLKSQGIKVIPVVPSVAYAKRLEHLGADAVIAEGMEAGGHIGKLTSMALIPQIVDAVSIPVIGAGGVGDGRGLAAMLSLGAQAVQIGTRFVLSNECTAHPNFKQMIQKSKDIDTVVSGTITGHPVRSLRNSLTRKLEQFDLYGYHDKETSVKRFMELGKGALHRAAKMGDVENGSVMAGQISGLLNEEASVKQIIDDMIRDCKESLQKIQEKMNVL